MASSGSWSGGWWKSSSGWQDDDDGASEAPDWGGGSEAAAVKEEAEQVDDEEGGDEEGGDDNKTNTESRKRQKRGGANRRSRLRWLAKERGTRMPPPGSSGEGHLRYDERSEPWKVKYLVEKAMKTQMADVAKLQEMLFKAETLEGWKWCRRLIVSCGCAHLGFVCLAI